MEKSKHNNSNENEINHTEINHSCISGERGLHLVRTQTRQLFCKKHSVYSNCSTSSYSEAQTLLLPVPEDTNVQQIIQKKKLVLSNFTRTQVIIFLSLVLIQFICSCSMSIMAPFFPKEAKEKGMGIFLAGCVFSFYALVVLVTAPMFGKVLPKVGAKTLFVGGMLLAGISNEFFGMLANVSDYTFTIASFVIRGMEALGAAAFTTSSFVYVVELYPDNVSTVMGVLETFIGLGLSVGPALGGILYSIGGFGLPFYFLGGIMIAAVPLSVFTLPNIESTRKDSEEDGSFWKLMRIPSVFIISLVIINSSNVWAFLDPTLEPHLEQLSLSSQEVGFVFLFFSSVYALSSSLCGWLADKYDNHWSLMIIGLVFSTMSLLILGPSPLLTTKPSTLWTVLASLSVLAASCALTMMPTFQGLLKCAVRSGKKKEVATYSLVAGTWTSMYSLGEVIGPIVGGVLFDNYGFPILSTVMAFITLVMAGVALIFFMCRDICTNYNNESAIKNPLLHENKCLYYGGCSNDCEVIIKGPVMNKL